MLEDKEIKSILRALDEKFEKQKQEYESTKRKIQDLCEHKILKGIMAGKKCPVCGIIFSYRDEKSTLQYIKVVNGIENLTDEHKQMIKNSLLKDNEVILRICNGEEVK